MMRKYLKLLLTHYSGWSATYVEHMHDPWVDCFRHSYPQFTGLVPILDSLTYREELKYLPPGMIPVRPSFILLANSDSYFVFETSDEGPGLFRSGRTLEEVYVDMMGIDTGLKQDC